MQLAVLSLALQLARPRSRLLRQRVKPLLLGIVNRAPSKKVRAVAAPQPDALGPGGVYLPLLTAS
jgi:hypothetical protein